MLQNVTSGPHPGFVFPYLAIHFVVLCIGLSAMFPQQHNRGKMSGIVSGKTAPSTGSE
jgi:hypothetical protein